MASFSPNECIYGRTGPKHGDRAKHEGNDRRDGQRFRQTPRRLCCHDEATVSMDETAVSRED